MTKPLCIELFCGTFGWGAGFISEGWDVVGFDIMDVQAELGVPRTEGCQLVLQDVNTLHGSQFVKADCIVASPPCQEYSYMAMPFSRGKAVRKGLRGEGDFPQDWRGSRTVGELRTLFDACFRIQREASEAAGREIPLVVENVRGAGAGVGWEGAVPLRELLPVGRHPGADAANMESSESSVTGQRFINRWVSTASKVDD